MFHVDSRKINPGDTFICLPGGEVYAEGAVANGAVDVIHLNRFQLAQFARQHFDNPARQLKVVGVTGTNGKTTVTHLVAEALKKLGYKPELLGTINSELTTPESIHIQQRMAAHLALGGTHFVMEVSSHAIDQGRIWGVEYDVKLLTNLAQDHLDYHKTLEEYHRVKWSFLTEPDPTALPDASEPVAIAPDDYKKEALQFKNPLSGEFNHFNMQAAQAILKALGISEDDCVKVLASATAPAGRFEVLPTDKPFTVIVDFAHTEDSLDNILKAAKPLVHSEGRLIVVFGCGGERDRDKRPKMVATAAKTADMLVLTQDNPRHEDQGVIMDDMLAGLPENYKMFHVEHIREKAIQFAIKDCHNGDVVVIAGKGHETIQIIGDTKYPLSDREVAISALADL